MEKFVEKYRIYIPNSISSMGDEGKVAFRQAWNSPHEFDTREDAYQWIADNPDLTRSTSEFFVLPYIRREW